MEIVHPITLRGATISLVPMRMTHLQDLCRVGLEEELWRFTVIQVRTTEDMRNYIDDALKTEAEGTTVPFVISENSSGRIIGNTRYRGINYNDRRLEVGFTWIGREWQRRGVNTEAKYLMLRHAFEVCDMTRVQFKVNAMNVPSRYTLSRIGACLEGTLRNYRWSEKGPCSLAVFSIPDTEWPQIRENLELRQGVTRSAIFSAQRLQADQ